MHSLRSDVVVQTQVQASIVESAYMNRSVAQSIFQLNGVRVYQVISFSYKVLGAFVLAERKLDNQIAGAMMELLMAFSLESQDLVSIIARLHLHYHLLLH